MTKLENTSLTQDYNMWQTIVNNLKSMLSDGENGLSSKRVVGFLAFVCCAVAFFVDQFTPYKVTPTLFESMMWIVIGALGITGAEKFAKK
jgi:hypothetical protein